MDAINAKEYKIWFGGSCFENWSEGHILSIIYSDRKYVNARYYEGQWRAVSGDEELVKRLNSSDCPIADRQYFQAAATAYAAAQDCVKRGLPLERLYECLFVPINPLVAPELMRLLMDDCGFSLETAFDAAVRCCADCKAVGVDETELYNLQPRTAHIVSILRKACSDILTVQHVSNRAQFRYPIGAACCGETVNLRVRVLSGSARGARLIVYGDNMREEREMLRHGDLFSCEYELPEMPQPLWYYFKIETQDGEKWLCPDKSGYRGRLFDKESGGFRLTVYRADFVTPAWFCQSVMYQIFPDRFAFSDDGTAQRGIEYHKSLGQTPELHNSIDEPVRWQAREHEPAYSPDDFYGGTFNGICGRLEYLKKLGITCIYLNPVVEARSNHRYDTSDYMKVDPILGTNEDFARLCEKAREKGIRIILDGVFSHTGADSRYFNRYGSYPGMGACQGEKSPYYDWYSFIHFPDDYKSWWGFKDLPEVDKYNRIWREYVISGGDSVVKTWLRRGASGWRLDVADEFPDETLELIRRAVKEEKPDAPIIGEVWEDAVLKESCGGRRRYALGASLDSVMNYPLRRAVLDFASGRISAYALRDFLISQQMNYPKPLYYSLMNMLGTHDVERVLTALSTDSVLESLSREQQLSLVFTKESVARARELEKLCAVIQFALPGVPSIYYGDEQGMFGARDPFNRQPFKEKDEQLHALYSELAAERNASPVLSTGEAVFSAESCDVLLILRYIRGGRDVFGAQSRDGAYLAAINRSHNEKYVEYDCTAAGLGTVRVTLKPLSAEIIRLA